MKLLYFGNERLDAQNLATALRASAPDCTVSWTSRVDRATKWIAENSDVATLVVESQIDRESWLSLVTCVRGIAPRPMVIAVVPEGTGPDPASSSAGADHYVERNSPQFRDLNMLVVRAAAGARPPSLDASPTSSGAAGPPPLAASPTSVGVASPPSPVAAAASFGAASLLLDLERKLADANAALTEAERRHAAAMAAAAEQLAGRQLQYEVATAGTAARWEVVDEQLRAAAIEAESARQNYTLAAAKIDRLSQRESELTSQLAAAAAKHDALERRLVDADAAVEAARARAAQERLEASDQLAERQRELQAQIDTELNKRVAVEGALAQAARARDEAEARHASAMADAAAQLRELDAALRVSRQDHESSDAEVKRLGACEAELSSTLAEVRTSHGNVERRLAATEAAYQDAEARATLERLTATRKAATREAELEGQIRREREARADLDRALAERETAQGELQQRFDRELAQSAADRVRLTEQMSEVERVLAQVRAERQSATTEVARLSQREADLSSRLTGAAAQLADVEAARQAIESQLTESTKAAVTRDAELAAQIQRERTAHEAALAAAAEQLTEHQSRADQELSQVAADRDRLTEQMSEVEGVLAQVRAEHHSATEKVARLTRREADLSVQLDGVAARLADSEAARQTVEGGLAEAINNSAAREAELDGRIKGERDARTDLERTLAESEAAWGAAHQEYETALGAAAHALAEQRARFDQELSQTSADRDRLTNELEAVLARARADHQAATTEIARLTRREEDLTSRLTSEAARLVQVEAARRAIERQLAERTSELHVANDRAARESAEAAAVKADLEARLTREMDTRRAVERVVEETRAAAAEAERGFEEQADGLRVEAREQRERFEAQIDQERAEHQRQRTELQEGNASLARERDGLRQSLAAAQEHSRQLDVQLRETRVHLDEVAEAADANNLRLTAGIAESERLLDEARTEHQATLDQLFSEHTNVVSAHRTEMDQLREQLAAAARDLEGTRQQLNVVQAEADTMPRLRRELEESRSEIGRLFQQSGLAMFRCTRNGEVRQANRAAMTLVGRRTIDEMRGAQFAAAVFEDPNGLSWLIERCLSSRTRESIEATWRRKDGGRLFVRLSAYACSTDLIEIIAEDLTRVRALQERLGQAHRMEAVGRIAGDVAVTCGNLLNDVHQQVQEWITTAGTTAASRQQGQQLLADVTRAAGMLRQLSVYGDEQARPAAVADLNTVIHDLEPVLQRVAGDAVAVAVQLPGRSSRLSVDVGTERIERLLVHLASYGRSRMASGGQLKIELGTTVVDRRFAAKHPNVRLGPHALITVTETRDTSHKTATPASGSPDPKPRIDFGTLQGLVGGCGGHLWMTVQPEGDLIAKIRLPLQLPSHDEVGARTLVARGGRVLTRLFQH